MASLFEISAGSAIGYVTGGAVTQITNKSTGVTINAPSGAITTNNASLATFVSFVVTNSFITANDVPILAIKSGATTGTYIANVSAVGAGQFTVTLSSIGTTASEALVINFVIMKAAAA